MLTRRCFLNLVAGAAMAPITNVAAQRSEMLQRKIPSSSQGEFLPVIGMGTSETFDVGGSQRVRAPLLEVLQAFYASGARLIDTSPMYGAAEEVTGALVEQLGRRADTFYATKVWATGREQGLAQIEQSLQLLRTPRLDLLQIHNLVDWRTHAATLRKLKDDGRLRYSGITHYTVSAHDDLEAVLRAAPFDFVQLNYSIVTRAAERRLLPLCQERGIGVVVNRPFEDGDLFARVRDRNLPACAAAIGCDSWAHFFLKFIISHPAVTCVIPATSRIKHMKDNLQAGFGPMPDEKMREQMARDFAD